VSQFSGGVFVLQSVLRSLETREGGKARTVLLISTALLIMDQGRHNTSRRYPYDNLAESGDYDEALEELNASKKDGEPHIPTFARNTLERLRDLGLLHRIDADAPVNVRKAKVGKEQVVWIRFDTHRDEHRGYTAVEVVDAPRSDTAILAAMMAWLAQPIDFDRLLESLRFFTSGAYEAEKKRIRESIGMTSQGLPRITGSENTEEDYAAALKALVELDDKRKLLEPLDYLLPLIRYYRPDFDGRSPEEQQELIEKTCGYVNDFLSSLLKLRGFLEYGAPDQKKLTPAIKEPARDVRAAVLYDVDELSYREIGERMRVSPPDLGIKGENQTVRKMADRGRRILEEAFGKEGWRKRAEKMKAERAWWQSLSDEQRDAILEEEASAF
jgi:hypothetical protein